MSKAVYTKNDEIKAISEEVEVIFVDKKGNRVRTFDEWNKILNAGIIDPDGFDRTDPQFNDRYYTQEEFEKGWGYSTCLFKADFKEVKNDKN